MKRIFGLIIVAAVTASCSLFQSTKIKEEPKKKVEYNEISNIIEYQDSLKLSQRQASALKIKHEYIKRDLQKLNAQREMDRVDTDLQERELKISYDNFVKQTLTASQLKAWADYKINQDKIAAQEGTYKSDLKKLANKYENTQKSIINQYGHDKKLYIAQRNQAKKNYQLEKMLLQQHYYKLENPSEEGEQVLTLEEIANLAAEYDKLYSQEKESSPLDNIKFEEEYQEEYSEENTENSEYTEEEYSSSNY